MDRGRIGLASLGLVAALGGTARAADAPVTMVEPEPAEYVRVCDVYGKGFFYIPGTETCLQFGGYVRFRVGGNSREFTPDPDGPYDAVYGTAMRTRLDMDAREETELGTLRAKIRLEANQILSQSAAFTVKEGFLQLGGLTVGTADSLWTNEDGGVSDGLLLEENDWAAGDFQTNRISYAYSVGKLTGILSVEDDGTGDWRPDVLGKLVYADGGLKAYLMGAYDEQQYDGLQGYANYLNRFTGRDPDGAFDGAIEFQPDNYAPGDDAFVLKGGVQLQDLLLDGSIFKVEGHYAFDPSIYAVVTSLSGSFGFGQSYLDPSVIPSKFQIGAAYSQEVGKFTFVVSGAYGQTEDLNVAYANGVNLAAADGESYFAVGGDINYKVTENFTITGEVTYRDLDLPAGIDDFDRTFGFLQFRRNF
ncbi:hypothetical protein GCM10011390_40980 [Aureimonas endophytica]|uniref:Porin n=1 Tax=Aureimonas endophytica TaxID=2027858 RepID=A0A916ZXC4_9HYPH|nr:porin [Aureimonas endophytica]GGE17642.1 hypothetical protein GCM10011390_40980 [Aureimonas endophytica]